MASDFSQTSRRLAYYAHALLRQYIPPAVYARRLASFRRRIEAAPVEAAILDRLAYYNRLDPGAVVALEGTPPPTVEDGSRYFHDFMEIRRYFPSHLAQAVQFGDVTRVPPRPTLVKSRPIGAGNANSVLLKLNKLRHFQTFADPVPFEDKLPKAVWRGAANKPQRRALVERHHDNPRCDVGQVRKFLGDIAPKPYLHPTEQLRYRYQISVEGNDVATNLKWVAASRALCLMPKPKFETWFMEGRLEAGVHYVELRPDYEDLDEKMDYFDRHPGEAKAIVANANAHARQFGDLRRERAISLLVLQTYFERTGQADAWNLR